jgi:hypothetical protein
VTGGVRGEQRSIISKIINSYTSGNTELPAAVTHSGDVGNHPEAMESEALRALCGVVKACFFSMYVVVNELTVVFNCRKEVKCDRLKNIFCVNYCKL